jgi:hypothetical protein
VVRGGEEQSGFAVAAWQALSNRLLTALAAEHQRAPDMVGVERERLRRLTLPTLTRAAFDALVAELLAQAASQHRAPGCTCRSTRPAWPPATATCSSC